MRGIVTLLPEPYYTRVESLWQMLEQNFELRGIRVVRYPHFSWNIAEEYPPQELKIAAEELAAQIPPFIVESAGIGLFTGPQPVIYIPLVKTAEMAVYHHKIWERVLPFARGLSPYYAPEVWMPHISLAAEDVTPQNVGKVMEWLGFQSFNWKMEVENLAYISEPGAASVELMVRLPLQGPPV